MFPKHLLLIEPSGSMALMVVRSSMPRRVAGNFSDPATVDPIRVHPLSAQFPRLLTLFLIQDPAQIQSMFPCIAEDAVAMLHIRRAGYMDARRLGAWLLERVRKAGVTILEDRVEAVHTSDGRVNGVTLASAVWAPAASRSCRSD